MILADIVVLCLRAVSDGVDVCPFYLSLPFRKWGNDMQILFLGAGRRASTHLKTKVLARICKKHFSTLYLNGTVQTKRLQVILTRNCSVIFIGDSISLV